MRAFVRGSERCEIERHDRTVIERRFEREVLVHDVARLHASAVRAKWEADRMCARLVDAGFERTAGDNVAPLGQAELEQALRAAPDDRETYLVYADWLSEHGDDWGQLIAVQHALETLPRFGVSERRGELARMETLLRFTHAARLWGALGETLHDEHTQTYLCDLLDATWQCGFVRAVRIRHVDDALLATLVGGVHDLPIACVLREVTLEHTGDIRCFTERTWPALEVCTIVGGAPVAPLVANAPHLRELRVTGAHDVDAVCSAVPPSVSHLSLRRCSVGSAGIDALARTTLQVLEIDTAVPRAHARLRHVAPRVVVHHDR